eukprot:2806179-Rhodomonas_salina.1
MGRWGWGPGKEAYEEHEGDPEVHLKAAWPTRACGDATDTPTNLVQNAPEIAARALEGDHLEGGVEQERDHEHPLDVGLVVRLDAGLALPHEVGAREHRVDHLRRRQHCDCDLPERDAPVVVSAAEALVAARRVDLARARGVHDDAGLECGGEESARGARRVR